MSDDFETVREALQGVFVTSSDEDEAFDKGNAALDRIESRLREAEDRQSNLPNKKWLDAFDEQRRLAHDLEHECDRLRQDLLDMETEASDVREDNASLREENARLLKFMGQTVEDIDRRDQR